MHLSDPREFPRYATARTIDDPPYTFLFNSENSFSGELFLLKNPPILVVSYERKFIRYANTIIINQYRCPQNKLSRQQRLQMRQP